MVISGLGCGEVAMDWPRRALAPTSTSGLMEVCHHSGKCVELLIEKVPREGMEPEIPDLACWHEVCDISHLMKGSWKSWF